MPNPEHAPSVISSQTKESQHTEIGPALSPSQEAFWHKVEAVIPKYADITDLSQVKERLRSLLATSSVTPETFATSSRRKQERLRPEIFALAGKAVELVTGLTPYETQYVTAKILTEGKIPELPSGEGKTIATGIATVFNALTHDTVQVPTANDYLARRDLSELGEVYTAFGLKSGVIYGDGKEVMQYDADPKAPSEDPKNFPHLVRIPFDPKHPYAAHQKVYTQCNIVYGTSKSLIFDEQIDTFTTDANLQRRVRIIEDSLTGEKELVPLEKASITADEVDKLAIDDALTPQILSEEELLTPEQIDQLLFADHVALGLKSPVYIPKKRKKREYQLVSGDYEVKEIDSDTPWVHLTESGWDKVLTAYRMGSGEFFAAGSPLPQLIQNALSAHAKILDSKTDPPTILFERYKKGQDYIVIPDPKNSHLEYQIVFIDKHTGRPLSDQKLDSGMHQALEAKEGFGKIGPKRIHGEMRVFARTTIQSWLRSYPDFSGTTGTAHQSTKLFQRFYKRDVEIVPPHRPSQLKRWQTDIISDGDHLTAEERTHRHILNLLKGVINHKTEDGTQPLSLQPFLIAAASEMEAHSLFELLQNDPTIRALIASGQLNLRQLTATNLTDEANFIAQAGLKNTITISTAIAGRGTHIELGGKKPTDTNGKVLPKESPEYQNWQKDHDEVVRLGGLFVMAATIPSTRRELEQLARRAARNGEPGSFKIVASIHSPLFVEYGEQTHQLSTRILQLMQARQNPPKIPPFVHHESLDDIIGQVQDFIEMNYADNMERIVHIDQVYQQQRTAFTHAYKEITQNTENWQKHIPNLIRRAIHEKMKTMTQLSSDQLGDDKVLRQHLDEILTIKDTIADQQYKFSLATIAEIYDHLKQQAAENYKPLYPLEKMSFLEQEQAITDYLIEKYRNVENATPPPILHAFIKQIAQNTLQGFWQQHLEELDSLQQQVSHEKLPIAIFANDAHELLTNHLTTLQLAIIQQLGRAALLRTVPSQTTGS